MCVNPKTVYRHTTYRKQTKNQWARDDPTFVVLSAIFVAVAALMYWLNGLLLLAIGAHATQAAGARLAT